MPGNAGALLSAPRAWGRAHASNEDLTPFPKDGILTNAKLKVAMNPKNSDKWKFGRVTDYRKD